MHVCCNVRAMCVHGVLACCVVYTLYSLFRLSVCPVMRALYVQAIDMIAVSLRGARTHMHTTHADMRYI